MQRIGKEGQTMKVNVGGNGLTMTELAQICGGMLCCVGGEVQKDLPFR